MKSAKKNLARGRGVVSSPASGLGRRRLALQRRTALAAAASWPIWLREAFAEDTNCPSDPKQAWRWVEVVASGYRRAQQAGKPLLVLVVPSMIEARWRSGRVFGELLNHGDDQTLALLAMTEIICSPISHLAEVVPQVHAKVASREPLMILVETHAVPAQVRSIDGELPEDAAPFDEVVLRELGPAPPIDHQEASQKYWERQNERENRIVRERIAAVATLLRTALVPNPRLLETRARLAEAKLSGPKADRWRLQPATRRPDPEILLAHAASIVHESQQNPDGERLLVLLAQAAREKLCHRRVPGSRWANESGCATRVEYEPGEEDDDMLFACGMGHVPELSTRFLDFLGLDGSWRRG